MKTPKLNQNKRDGIWFISYYENGERIRNTLGTKDRMLAGLKFTQITGFPVPTKYGIVAPSITQPTTPRSLYVGAVNEFIESKWGLQNAWTAKRIPQSYARKTLALGVLKKLQAFGSITYLEDVTFQVLQGYVALLTHNGGINGKGMVASSIVGHIGFIRRFLTFCVNMEYINKNEANKLDRIKRKAPVRYSFNKDEVSMILENCTERFLPFFELMLETGIRACDMWNLTKDNFPGGDFIYIKQGKTGDILNVPISNRAQEIVAALPYRLFPWADRSWSRQNGEMDQQVAVRNELRICFAGDRDDGCIKRGEEICRPKGIRLHTFRHTFAMWKLAAGCPLEVIKDLMGHKSVAMAELYAIQLPKIVLAKWV